MEMTREQVLAEMETSFGKMAEEDKNYVLFSRDGKDWTPTMLLEEVRNDTDYGKEYVQGWARSKDEAALLEGLLDAILGGGNTCGDPDCPNCHGEIRPLTQG